MNHWLGNDVPPNLKEIAKHCERINNASLKFLIILNSYSGLMDGGHRFCKALNPFDHKTVQAVQFQIMPALDEIIDLRI